MCGIVGYVGQRSAAPILLEGLRRLEYRGYDSAGLAVLTDEHTIDVRKTEGKLARLIEQLDGSVPAGSLGIGHTRWATHGAPTTANAHPHLDCRGEIVVVHNGIIENYAELRADLLDSGHRFSSDTDTEVLAHLIEAEYRRPASNGGREPFVEAVRVALARVTGAYAIAAFTRQRPDLLVGARHFSPLVVGLGEGETFLASDVPALLGHTRQVIFLNDGEVAALRPDGVSVLRLSGESVVRAPTFIEWDAQAAEKGGFEHFVQKEIFEQPEALRNALRGRIREAAVVLPELDAFDWAAASRLCIVAAGTSYYAGLVGKMLLERWARLPVEVAIASEFRYLDPILDEHTLVLLVSQSGETADTLAAMRLAYEHGARTLGLSNVVGSSLARGVESVLYLQVGPEIGVVATKTFVAQLALLALMAIDVGRRRRVPGGARTHVLEALRQVPSQIEQVLDGAEAIARLAERFADRRSMFFMGRGFGYPVALEGALKLKEISYIHAEGYPAGELKHGPIAMLDPSLPVFAIATQSPTHDKVISNLQEVRARQAEVFALATESDERIRQHADHVIYLPAVLDELSPLLAVVPLQLFAYYVALARGCDVDQPRNLAKSVTVE